MNRYLIVIISSLAVSGIRKFHTTTSEIIWFGFLRLRKMRSRDADYLIVVTLLLYLEQKQNQISTFLTSKLP